MTVAERAALPCMEPGRADVLVPGIVICLAVMARFEQSVLVVSDHGLLEGLILRALGRCAVPAAKGEPAGERGPAIGP